VKQPRQPDAQRDLENVERPAKLLDTEFEFAGIRFGLDAIVGLSRRWRLDRRIYRPHPIYVAQQHKLGWPWPHAAQPDPLTG
jgi:hypothetical protein